MSALSKWAFAAPLQRGINLFSLGFLEQMLGYILLVLHKIFSLSQQWIYNSQCRQIGIDTYITMFK